mmetsp:Transcript_45860/g.74831  ORF Transcript_45860/g.74831 Transcript_45860/m.74831 type:complete len:227 (+) Transcript_45860:150-830(+)|eukprot:CAMPEP_0184655974 /NCGR_PEP_ID=MMETSP0308-20130426/15118_1 /TAXON_ID=38269 /ORGANISM="Gloeochaete witrockiana, Strain SAG 46.84" /LENGTH=226 /DNA_ID=CAMNT_0027092827 /DNA_START=113 /DNA_END=793 /DNA_ORIENTATION=+
MRKLIEGVLDFRARLLPGMRHLFAELKKGQKPDSLFIACSDSRVVPNLFSSTNPGELFVLRNVGNIVPPAAADHVEDMLSEGACVEFSVGVLSVKDIIVCGHSECGAMKATNSLNNPEVTEKPTLPPHLNSWLKYSAPAFKRMLGNSTVGTEFEVHNRLSQVNVLQQLDHIHTYPIVAERLKQNKIRLHGWWYDIGTGDVYVYDQDKLKFCILDEEEAHKILQNYE